MSASSVEIEWVVRKALNTKSRSFFLQVVGLGVFENVNILESVTNSIGTIEDARSCSLPD